MGLVRYSPRLVAMKCGWVSVAGTKERLFSHYFKGVEIELFRKWCEAFSRHLQPMIRPKAQTAIRKHLEAGDTLVIVSASIDEWIRPWAIAQGFHEVIATQAEVDPSGRLTGRFATPNCIRQEKVTRLLLRYPDRQTYELWAYGDSRGDRELIDFADQGWYNRFRSYK